MSRFRHWRAERNGIKPETIATLCAMSGDDLLRFEAGGSIGEADAAALELLFGDEFAIAQLFTRRTAQTEEHILAAMDRAFERTMRSWTRRAGKAAAQ